VQALIDSAGYNREEAETVIREAKETRAEERRQLTEARLTLKTLIAANGRLLAQVEKLEAENAALRSLKKRAEEHDDSVHQERKKLLRASSK
jgi:hypothetical protein